MTAHPRPPHDEDDDLDLRALYRTLPRAEPGPDLDAAVRQAAARATAADRRVQRQHRLWHPGWGVAASILLTACLFLLTDFQDPDVAGLADAPPVNADLASPPQTVQRAAPPAPAPAQPDAAAALRRYAPAPQAESATPGQTAPAGTLRPQQYGMQAVPPRAMAPVDGQQEKPAAPSEPAQRDADADARIAHVRSLLQAGRRDEALAALQALRRDAPGLALPADLQRLLPPAP